MRKTTHVRFPRYSDPATLHYVADSLIEDGEKMLLVAKDGAGAVAAAREPGAMSVQFGPGPRGVARRRTGKEAETLFRAEGPERK
jgi:hypothetical protein